MLIAIDIGTFIYYISDISYNYLELKGGIYSKTRSG